MKRFLAGAAAVALAALAAMALAACGSDDDGGETTTVTAAATETPATTTSEEEGAGTEAEPPIAETGETTDSESEEPTADGSEAPEGEALATTETTIAGATMRIDIVELVRQDEVVTLTFTVTNTTPKESDVFYHAFDDNGLGTAVDGLLLIDPTSGREYKVVRNPGQGCLCSDELPFTLGGDESINLSATFDAPPQSVKAANVSFPGSAGTLTDVPISES